MHSECPEKALAPAAPLYLTLITLHPLALIQVQGYELSLCLLVCGRLFMKMAEASSISLLHPSAV